MIDIKNYDTENHRDCLLLSKKILDILLDQAKWDQEELLAKMIPEIANSDDSRNYDSGVQDGYDDGHREGYDEGYRDGKDDCECKKEQKLSQSISSPILEE